MRNDLNSEFTSLESRINVLEQRFSSASLPAVTVTPSPTNGYPVVTDSLTWSAGYQSYTRVKIGVSNPLAANYPSLSWITPSGTPATYNPAQAIRIGSLGFLTGLVIRTGATLGVGRVGVNDSKMFTLPINWRPTLPVAMLCLAGTTAPEANTTIGGVWIEARPDTAEKAGGVYLVATNVAINQNVGWIALQGTFPCSDIPGP